MLCWKKLTQKILLKSTTEIDDAVNLHMEVNTPSMATEIHHVSPYKYSNPHSTKMSGSWYLEKNYNTRAINAFTMDLHKNWNVS